MIFFFEGAAKHSVISWFFITALSALAVLVSDLHLNRIHIRFHPTRGEKMRNEIRQLISDQIQLKV